MTGSGPGQPRSTTDVVICARATSRLPAAAVAVTATPGRLAPLVAACVRVVCAHRRPGGGVAAAGTDPLAALLRARPDAAPALLAAAARVPPGALARALGVRPRRLH